MKEKLLNEKNELIEQMLEIKKSQLEHYQEFDNALTQKTEAIEKKDRLLNQKNKEIVILLFLFLLVSGALLLTFFIGFLQKT